MARSLEFGVRGSELTWNFTEVKQDGGFLDIGFSSCTVPTFCHSLVISDVGLDLGAMFGVMRSEEVESCDKSSGVQETVRTSLNCTRVRARRF